VPLRSQVKRYLLGRERLDILEFPEYTTSNILEKIPAEDVQFLSVFDLHLTSDFEFNLKLKSFQPMTSMAPISSTSNTQGVTQNNIRDKQASNSYSSNQLKTYRKSLFEQLNDSVSFQT
jgi:hypothetical protein